MLNKKKKNQAKSDECLRTISILYRKSILYKKTAK